MIKPAIVTAFAILALAGPGLAQSPYQRGVDDAGGHQAAVDRAAQPDQPGVMRPPNPLGPSRWPPSTQIRRTTLEMRQACLADRQTLCAGRSESGADSCIAFNRRKASEPCKQALVRLQLARDGRL